MNRCAALALMLPAALGAAGARAATAYVTDELVLNAYSEPNQQGQRLATLHSGTSLEALAVNGEFTQVRMPDGVTGWVKSTYLTTQIPAAARVRQLEEEIDRSRSTTPGLAEAAARSEVEQLQRTLTAKQAELAARAAPATLPAAARMPGGATAGAVLCAAGAGFWAGYVTLARRVRRKFGGLRVY